MKECRFLALPYWPSFWNPKLHPSIFVSRQWFCHMPKLLHVAELWWLWGPWRVQWTHLHVQENVLKWTQLSDAVCFPAGGHDTRGGFGITVMLSWHLSAKNAPNNMRPPAAAGWMDLLWILTLPCWRKEIDLSGSLSGLSDLLLPSCHAEFVSGRFSLIPDTDKALWPKELLLTGFFHIFRAIFSKI